MLKEMISNNLPLWKKCVMLDILHKKKSYLLLIFLYYLFIYLTIISIVCVCLKN